MAVAEAVAPTVPTRTGRGRAPARSRGKRDLAAAGLLVLVTLIAVAAPPPAPRGPLAARPHVAAARLAGAGQVRIALRHLLPGVVPAAVVTASLDIGTLVLTLAGLSFLGLGQSAPAPELGADTARNLSYLLQDWW